MRRLSSRAIAHHEAGHAVVATLYGGLERVTISDPPQALFYPDLFSNATAVGVTLYAGVVAQAKSRRDNLLFAILNGGANDRQRIEQLLDLQVIMGQLGEEAVGAERACWLTLTKNVVRTAWPAIRTVAEQLLVVGTLTGEEVTRLIEPCGIPLDPQLTSETSGTAAPEFAQ